MFQMHVTDQNLVVVKNKIRIDYTIFEDSNGVEYIRLSGTKFIPLSATEHVNARREKTAIRGEKHVYPHRSEDLPAGVGI